MGVCSEALIEIVYNRDTKFSPRRCVEKALLRSIDEFVVSVEDLDNPQVWKYLGKNNPKDKTKHRIILRVCIWAEGLYAARIFDAVAKDIASHKPVWYNVRSIISF